MAHYFVHPWDICRYFHRPPRMISMCKWPAQARLQLAATTGGLPWIRTPESKEQNRRQNVK